MKYISTNQKSRAVSLKEAVLSGMAPDGGLFMPEMMPVLDQKFIRALDLHSFQEISLAMASAFLADDVPPAQLFQIVNQALNFPLELIDLDDRTSVLETFHGPTMAFKDFGARFMAQLMAYLIQGEARELSILVATSGDTGSAVASGFLGVPGIRVIILYPSGKVSPSQEKQLTTQGQNIQALEVAGNFDDCQLLVKTAFADAVLRKQHQLSSANSINIARLIPQSFYYAYAVGQLLDQTQEVTFSVPSGNFGNLTAGLFAQRMGVPIKHFVAATNANDVFPTYLSEGQFTPRPSNQTLSNAMDVGNPSNLARIRYLFGDDLKRIKAMISSWSFSDAETRDMMGAVYRQYDYVIDPHTAVGFLGLEKFRSVVQSSGPGLVISTAHPAKFPESVEPVIGQSVSIPPQLARYLDRKKQVVVMSNQYDEFRQYLFDTLDH